VAATEGEVKIPATVARYSDSKSTIYLESSPSIKIEIKPKRKPDLVLEVDPPAAVEQGGEMMINVTVENRGEASAYRVEVESDLGSGNDGLEIVKGSLDESFFEIPPGGTESYSATVRGSESGAKTVGLVASYQGDGEMMQKETAFEIVVLEREHRYIYYLPVVPVVIMGVWLFRRYKEYKY